MIDYISSPRKQINIAGKHIMSFNLSSEGNVDATTVKSFGDEWQKFSAFSEEDIKTAGDQYFDIVTDKMVNLNTVALDMGCGSGRWTKYLANRVKFIEAVDPSDAVFTATKLLADTPNTRVTQVNVDHLPFAQGSFDFVFSLGVLHHIPNTPEAVKKTVEQLKQGGYCLLYLYYNLDNRSILYKMLFLLSNSVRWLVSKFPKWLKSLVCDLIAMFVYIPFVLAARFAKSLGFHKSYKRIPLSYYADKSFYIIRNDALDRFGTPLEQRFSRKQIEKMMVDAGLEQIKFSEHPPFWHAVGKKK